MEHSGNDALLRLWETMVLIRSFELRLQSLFRAGKVPGLTHLCTGQEAVAAGICAALGPGDRIASSHRGHGHTLAHGTPPEPVMAEILGRVTGLCGGRVGSMHLFDAERGNLGTNGIVGGGVPLAVGAGLAAKSAGDGRVAVAFFGDGALNQGVVLECLNMAALWRLPVLLVCEHNGYGEFTASDDVTAGDIHARLAAYGLPVEDIDGMDAALVLQTAQRGVARARAGDGPTVILARAWRFSGHHAGDAQDYKDDAETRAWRARDPIPRLRERLLEAGTPAERLDRIEAEVKNRIDAAVKAALAAPEPGPELLEEKVYA
jgi:pyruvate dehydrogenase E1 component alpha subunit